MNDNQNKPSQGFRDTYVVSDNSIWLVGKKVLLGSVRGTNSCQRQG